jgi:hypothetical protein
MARLVDQGSQTHFHVLATARLDASVGKELTSRLMRYAARTVSMNLPTSRFSRLLSFDSDCAAESTCDEAAPVSATPR